MEPFPDDFDGEQSDNYMRRNNYNRPRGGGGGGGGFFGHRPVPEDAPGDGDGLGGFGMPSMSGGGFGRRRKAEAAPADFVTLAELRQATRKDYALEVLKRRDKVVMPVASAAAADAAERDPDGNGVSPLRAYHFAEMNAAEMDDDVMYHSSCSEDPDVLEYELDLLGVRYGTFEEDNDARRERSERDAHRQHMPPNAQIFEENTMHSAEAAGAAAGGDSNSAYAPRKRARVDDESSSHVDAGGHSRAETNESRESRMRRVAMLRAHLYREKHKRGFVADECFKCMHGNDRYDTVYARPVQKCFELLYKDIGRMELRAIAKTVHKYFKHAIYLPMRKLGHKIPMWRTQKVYEHLTQHDQDPRLALRQNLDDMRSLLAALRNKTHTRDKEGRLQPNPKNVRAYLDSMKLWKEMSAMDTKKMAFHDDSAKIGNAAASNSTSTTAASTVGAGGVTALHGRFVIRSARPGQLH